jgi:hypothetical protein
MLISSDDAGLDTDTRAKIVCDAKRRESNLAAPPIKEVRCLLVSCRVVVLLYHYYYFLYSFVPYQWYCIVDRISKAESRDNYQKKVSVLQYIF